jgi:hypothetical protein
MNKVAVVEVPIAKNEVRDIPVQGMVVRGALAPIDFPDRLRIGIEDHPAPCHVFIDFLYPMGQDEPVQSRAANGGKMWVGITSGRVFRVEIAVPEGTKKGHIRLDLFAVQSGLKQLQSEANKLPLDQRPPRRIAHYGMLSDLLPDMAPVIEKKLDELRQAE